MEKMSFKSARTFVLLIGLCGMMPNLSAESLDLPQGKETFSITLPGRGMTMESVREQFGEPQEKHTEVGKPPITRWVYEKFTVYFESKYVIHAVFHSPKK